MANTSPRTFIGLAAAIVILGCLSYLVYRLFPGQDTARAAAANPVLLKCTNPACGEVFRTTLEDVWQRRTKAPPIPGSPGLPCPKCGQNTQASAAECPNDHTIFLTDPADRRAKDIVWSQGSAPHPVCPTCRWDPEKPQAPAN